MRPRAGRHRAGSGTALVPAALAIASAPAFWQGSALRRLGRQVSEQEAELGAGAHDSLAVGHDGGNRYPAAVSPPQHIVPGPLRSVTPTRMTSFAVMTATVTVSPGALEPLCRMLLAKSSSTSSAATSPHGCPGRAPRPRRRGRPAPALPAPQASRSPGLPWPSAQPPFPARTGPGKCPGPPDGRTRGCTLDSAARVKPGQTVAASAARPWPSVETPTVRIDRHNCAYQPSQVCAPTVLTPRTPVRYASVGSAI